MEKKKKKNEMYFIHFSCYVLMQRNHFAQFCNWHQFLISNTINFQISIIKNIGSIPECNAAEWT